MGNQDSAQKTSEDGIVKPSNLEMKAEYSSPLYPEFCTKKTNPPQEDLVSVDKGLVMTREDAQKMLDAINNGALTNLVQLNLTEYKTERFPLPYVSVWVEPKATNGEFVTSPEAEHQFEILMKHREEYRQSDAYKASLITLTPENYPELYHHELYGPKEND